MGDLTDWLKIVENNWNYCSSDVRPIWWNMFETGAKRWVVWLTRCKFERMLTITWACVWTFLVRTLWRHTRSKIPPVCQKLKPFTPTALEIVLKMRKKCNNKKSNIFGYVFSQAFLKFWMWSLSLHLPLGVRHSNQAFY